jgi:hypothetical protein
VEEQAVELLILAAGGDIELPMPAWAYGVVAGVVFVALGLVTYSYRNVANRHAHKNAPTTGHTGEH